ncbi:MAG: lig [Nitrospira sp.]|jgi:DNA ligase-1|nr:lig [Nitrospira sp.]
MELARLVSTVQLVREAAKKTEKVRLLGEFLRQTHGHETKLVALYLSGSLSQGKIGIGWTVLRKAMGDGETIGDPLTLADVDQTFAKVATERGSGSTERRIAELAKLFVRAAPVERQFLARLVMGEIRQGALEGLLLEAIAKGAGRTVTDVRQAFMYSGNIGAVAQAAMEEGADGLARFSLSLFKPVSPMLADSAVDVDEALERLEEASLEYKLDGARIQVHKGHGDVKIFTRQLQDVTERLPDMVEWARALPAREALLDGEALALRPDGRPHPFQVTMRRFGRSSHVEAMRNAIPLTPFMFDLLYLDGEPLVDRPYQERIARLLETAPAAAVPRLVTNQTAAAKQFLQQALGAGHEGIMAKSVNAPYRAGQRGSQWLKLKEAITLDLVILAAEWGNGRRSGWLSNLHLGARDAASGRMVMLGKTFKGLTDEMLRWQTEKLLSLETHREETTLYVRPELLAEIAFSDVQESPRYPAGLALRFARVKRYRLDKLSEQADTIQTVTDIFNKQRA